MTKESEKSATTAWTGSTKTYNKEPTTLKREAIPILGVVFVVLCSLAFTVYISAAAVSERTSTAHINGQLSAALDELERAETIIANLPGALIRVCAETGIVRSINIGAVEIFGPRGIEVGATMFDIIGNPEHQDRHRYEIFGPNAIDFWEKRIRDGRLAVTCEINRPDGGREWRNLAITARLTNGRKEYNVFVDPRRYDAERAAAADADEAAAARKPPRKQGARAAAKGGTNDKAPNVRPSQTTSARGDG